MARARPAPTASGPRLDPSLLSRVVPTGPTDPIIHYRTPVIGWLFRTRINLGLGLLPSGPLGRVLEVGYGSGVVQLALGSHTDELHGIDLDADPELVGRMLEEAGMHSQLRRGSVLDLPYPDRSFDQVVCFSVVEHLTAYRKALEEMARVTRPGGSMLI